MNEMLCMREWMTFCARIGAKGARKEFRSLVQHYTEPHRFYHNLKHIAHCLKEFSEVRYLAMHPDEVEMALWYHDIIYNTKANDNEEKSAKEALNAAKRFGINENFGRRVYELVLATTHKNTAKNIDAQILTDVDLCIFGRPRQEFLDYDEGIRREYSWVSWEVYRKKRAEILQGFLNRKSIYVTDYFKKKYELNARRNIEVALKNINKI